MPLLYHLHPGQAVFVADGVAEFAVGGTDEAVHTQGLSGGDAAAAEGVAGLDVGVLAEAAHKAAVADVAHLADTVGAPADAEHGADL